ncbi:hypothetical protein [Bryobacter aggregatus]|uniref:hypothetical protein n=1 Tax=Bryobacter aggregatus TaxID=360054 RepID=UPI0004E13A1D|nr:hypothetical protein [Bryobacter aggregatus]
MQVLQAGIEKYILLELDAEALGGIASQAGFDLHLEETNRAWIVDLTAQERQAPLLLFDASDPGNLGWFSRCQFYVDGASGNVLQTPIAIANLKDRRGNPSPNGLRMHIAKEISTKFKLPGRVAVNEQMIYQVFYNLLHALQNVGVGLCGGPSVRALAGRGENAALRS